MLFTAVNTNELETKLKTVFSVNLSSINALRNKRHVFLRFTLRFTSIFILRFILDSNDSQEIERDFHKEKEAYSTLI